MLSPKNVVCPLLLVAIPISAPFAMSEFLPPEIWQAISILLRDAR